MNKELIPRHARSASTQALTPTAFRLPFCSNITPFFALPVVFFCSTFLFFGVEGAEAEEVDAGPTTFPLAFDVVFFFFFPLSPVFLPPRKPEHCELPQ